MCDELFDGPNDKEGSAIAYGCLKYYGVRPNTILLASTHCAELAVLAQELPDKFACYCVPVNKAGKALRFTYRLQPGVYNGNIVFDLLLTHGWNPEVIKNGENFMREHYAGK